MTDNAGTWETTSGLVDDFDATIVDAWFATHSRYNNGNTTLLFWKVETDDEEHPVLDDDEAIRFSVGKDWDSLDGGKTVEHPGGKTKFNNQSAIGVLIGRCMEIGAGEELISRGPAQNADVWVGLRFHMKREEYTYNAPDGKGGREDKKGERLLPISFLGTSENAQPTSSPSADAPATPSILSSLDPALVETLKATKSNTANHSAFVDAAMELTEVTGNTTLVMALATPDGVYAEL